MNILAIADRGPRQAISQILSQNQVELICTLGDLDISEIRELGELKTIPKFGVYGNHCSGTYFEPLGITNLHLQTVVLNGITFGGFEGCVRYKAGQAIMYTQEEAEQLITSLPPVDVMLTHCPPLGINDDPEDPAHIGFRALRQYLESSQPKLWLHGHTYPTDEKLIKQFGNTRIEYIYQDRIIEF